MKTPAEQASLLLATAWVNATEEWNRTRPGIDWSQAVGWPGVLSKHQIILIAEAIGEARRQEAYDAANKKWPLVVVEDEGG